MLALEYQLATALIKRMCDRNLVSKEQYLYICTFLEEMYAREPQNGTDSQTQRTTSHGEKYL